MSTSKDDVTIMEESKADFLSMIGKDEPSIEDIASYLMNRSIITPNSRYGTECMTNKFAMKKAAEYILDRLSDPVRSEVDISDTTSYIAYGGKISLNEVKNVSNIVENLRNISESSKDSSSFIQIHKGYIELVITYLSDYIDIIGGNSNDRGYF